MCYEQQWLHNFKLLEEYKEEMGNLDIPARYETIDGLKLGQWFVREKAKYRLGTLSEDRTKQFKSLGINCELKRNIESISHINNNKNLPWRAWYQLLLDYKNKYGNINISSDYEINGYPLGEWVISQSIAYSRGKLDSDQIKSLKEVGLVLEPKSIKKNNMCKKAMLEDIKLVLESISNKMDTQQDINLIKM